MNQIVKNFQHVADAELTRTTLDEVFAIIRSGIPCVVVSKYTYDDLHSTNVYVPALNRLYRATHNYGVRVYVRALCRQHPTAQLLGKDEIFEPQAVAA